MTQQYYVVGRNNAIMHGTHGLILREPVTGRRGRTASARVDVSVTDTGNDAAWLINEDPGTVPSELDPTWSSILPTSWMLSPGAGDKTVCLWAKDHAGNVGARPRIGAIALESSAPGADGGAADTGLADATSTGDGGVTTDASATMDGGGADGGVTDAGSSVPDPTLILRDQTTQSMEWTNAHDIDIEIGNDASAVAWAVSEYPFVPDDPADPRWTTSEPTTFSLTPLEGLKTVYVWVKDASGVMNGGTASATIQLDLTAPAPPRLQWEWENPQPFGHSINDVWASEDAVLAVGEAGTILRLGPDGKWVLEDSRTPQDLRGIWGDGTGRYWAVGEYAIVFSASPGVWVEQTSSVRVSNLFAVWGSSGTDLYAVGDGDGDSPLVLRSTGDGRWTASHTSTRTTGLRAIWGSGPSDVYAVGGGHILHSTGVDDWTQQGSSGFGWMFAVWGSGANDVYVGGRSGILHSIGDGSWSVDASGIGGVRDFYGTGPGDLYAVGRYSVMVHATGPGTWTDVAPAGLPGDDLNAIAGRASGEIWAFGGYGSQAYRDAAGAWTAVRVDQPGMSPCGGSLNAVGGTGAGDVVAVGDSGLIASSPGDGTWQAQYDPSSALLYGTWSTPSGDLWAVGNNGTILRRAPVGAWTQERTGSEELYGVWASSASEILAVGKSGSSGVVLRSSGNGTWAPDPIGSVGPLYRIWGRHQWDVHVCGTNQALHSMGGGSWTVLSSAPGGACSGIWGIGSTDVYAAASSLYRDDGSRTWSLVRRPELPGAGTGRSGGAWGDGATELHFLRKQAVVSFDGTSWTTQRLGFPSHGIWASAPGDVYVVGHCRRIVHGTHGFVLRDPATGNRRTTTTQLVEVSVPALSDVAHWLISDTQSTAPTETDPGWTSAPPSSFTLSAGPGDKTVYLWLKDAAGNVSARSMPATITLL